MRYFLSLLVVVFVVVSCKKKDTTPEPVAATNTPAPTTSLSSMQAMYMIYDYGSSNITKDSIVFASFYDGPATSSPPNRIYAGVIKLNDTILDFNSLNNTYSKNSAINLRKPLKWEVSGSGTVTAFSHSFVPSYPVYNGASLLPDTCILANGINVNISNFSNTEHVSLSIYQGSNSINKTVPISGGNISVSASELASFTANGAITIMISFNNSDLVQINGVYQSFITMIEYVKSSYLK